MPAHRRVFSRRSHGQSPKNATRNRRKAGLVNVMGADASQGAPDCLRVEPLAACVSMPDAPLLSIVIVAYQSRDEIGPCLASLPRTLGGRAVETIVVDNSPGDGTGEIVRAQFPHVAYLAPG